MKMHAFRVIQRGAHTLEQVVAHVHSLALVDRFLLGRNELRIETVHDGARFLRFNFGKARSGHGPGQMSANEAVDRIDLPEGRQFGEDTAVVFDKVTRTIAIQFNQFGPRASAIEAYLSAADLSLNPSIVRTGFDIAGHFRPEFYDRLRRMQVIKELTVKVSLPGATRHDRMAGRAMSSILNAPLPDGAETVTLKIKPSRHKGSTLAPADVATWVGELLEHRGAGLKSGRVVGRYEERGRNVPIDLIEDQVSAEETLPPGLGQRMVLGDRWQALERAILAWIANREIPAETGQVA